MKIKLSIVEDQDSPRELLETIAKSSGLEVRSFKSAECFLKDYAESIAHIYLLDCNLPGISGIELTKIIRSKDSMAIIFIISGNNCPDDVNYGLLNGADDYILKPFTVSHLTRKIERAAYKIKLQSSANINYGLKLIPSCSLISLNGQMCIVGKKEFLIMEILTKNHTKAVSKAMIANYLGENLNDLSIENLIHSLRKKLSMLDIQVKSQRGLGYRLIYKI